MTNHCCPQNFLLNFFQFLNYYWDCDSQSVWTLHCGSWTRSVSGGEHHSRLEWSPQLPNSSKTSGQLPNARLRISPNDPLFKPIFNTQFSTRNFFNFLAFHVCCFSYIELFQNWNRLGSRFSDSPLFCIIVRGLTWNFRVFVWRRLLFTRSLSNTLGLGSKQVETIPKMLDQSLRFAKLRSFSFRQMFSLWVRSIFTS